MGDNNTKWEPVKYGDLKHGDRARITNAKGDVIYGRMESERFTCDFGDVGAWALDKSGYSFERAVPERTLPTTPGLYVSQTMIERGMLGNARVQKLREDGTWADEQDAAAQHRRNGLVRLAPVTEVEEAEKRIQAAREYVADPGNWSGLDGRRRMILSLLDGEDAS